MASNSIVSYMKRLGSSVAYAAVDLTKDYTPNTRALFENNKEYIQTLYRDAAHSVQELRQIDKIKDNTIFRQLNTGWKNIKDSVKTGKFYDEGREMAGALSGMDQLGDLMSQMEGLLGGETEQVMAEMDGQDTGSTDPTAIRGIPEVTKGDIVVASANTSAIRSGTNAIASAIVSTAELNNRSTRTISNIQLKALQQQANAMITGFNNVSSSLHAISEFNENVIGTHVQNSRIFFEQMTNYTRENNAILKEMLDIKRNMYQATMSGYDPSDKAKEYGIFDENGNFDLKKYSQYAEEKLKKSPLGALVALTKIIPMTLGQALANPLHSLTKMAIESIIDTTLKTSLKKLDNSLNGYIETGLAKLANFGKDNKDSFLGKIASIFGYKEETPRLNAIDTSKYNKGPMQWNGIAQKALVEVIPGHLRRIEASLTGESERVFNFQSGKWTNTRSIKHIENEIDRQTIGQAFKPIEKEMGSRLKFNSVTDRRKFSRAAKEFEKGVAKRGMLDFQHIQQKPNEYGSDKNLVALIATILQSGMVDQSSIVNLTTQLNAAKRQKRAIIEGFGGEQGLAQEYLNNSFNEKWAKGSATGPTNASGQRLNTPTTPLTDLMDKRGHTLYDYQYNILATLQRGIGGGNGQGNIRNTSNGPTNGPIFLTETSGPITNNYTPSSDTISESVRIGRERAAKKRLENNKVFGVEDETNQVIIKSLDELSNNQQILAQSLSDIAEIGVAATQRREEKFSKESNEGFISQALGSLKELGIDTDGLKNREGFLGSMLKATTVADKFKVVSDSLSSLTSAPQAILTSVFTSADKFMYDFLFDHETTEKDEDGNPVTGFFGKVTKEFEKVTDNINNKINEWMSKYLKDGAKGVAGWLKNFAKDTLGIDVDKRIQQAKDYASSLKESTFNAGKDIFHTITGAVTGTFDDVKNGVGKLFPDKDQGNQAPETRSRGITKNTKYGLAVVGPGEAIIPADLNPWNPHREATNIRSQAINENKIKQDFMDKLKGSVDANAISSYAEGTKSVGSGVSGELPAGKGANNREPDGLTKAIQYAGYFASNFGNIFKGMNQFANAAFGTNVQKASKVSAQAIKDNFPEIAKGSMGGLLASAVLPLGGPLFAAVTGSAVSIAAHNKSFQEYIFGKEIVDQEGKKGRDNSGLISQNTVKTIQKYLPDAKKYGITGALAGLILPFGPLGGMMIGAGASILKNNRAVNDFLFGEKGGLLTKDRKEKIKRAMPNIAAATLGTLFLGPFGVMGNAVLGAGLGILSTTETFKKIMLGPKDKNGERHGGIAGVIRRNITDPFKNSMKEMSKNVAKWFKDDVFNPLSNAIKPVGKMVLGFTKDKLKQGFDAIFGEVSKTRIGKKLVKSLDNITGKFSHGLGGFVRWAGKKVGRGISNVTHGIENKVNQKIVPLNYKHGWMGGTAQERLDALRDAGIDPTEDRFRDVYAMDQALLDLGQGPEGESRLKNAQLAIEAYQDLLTGSGRNIQRRINASKDNIESTTTKNLDKYLSDNADTKNPHELRREYERIVDKIEDIKDKKDFESISKYIQRAKLPMPLKKQLEDMLQETGTEILNYKNAQDLVANNKDGTTEKLRHDLAKAMHIDPKDNETLDKILKNKHFSDLIQNEIYGKQDEREAAQREQEDISSMSEAQKASVEKELPAGDKLSLEKQDQTIEELKNITGIMSDIRDAFLRKSSASEVSNRLVNKSNDMHTIAGRISQQRDIAEAQNNTMATAVRRNFEHNESMGEDYLKGADINMLDRLFNEDSMAAAMSRAFIKMAGGGLFGDKILESLDKQREKKNMKALENNVEGFKEGQEKLNEEKKDYDSTIKAINRRSRKENNIAEHAPVKKGILQKTVDTVNSAAQTIYDDTTGAAINTVEGAKEVGKIIGKEVVSAIKSANQISKLTQNGGIANVEDTTDDKVANPVDKAKAAVKSVKQITDLTQNGGILNPNDVKNAFAGIPFYGNFAGGGLIGTIAEKAGSALNFASGIKDKLFGKKDKEEDSKEESKKPEAKKYTNDDFTSDELRASSNAISSAVQEDKTKAQGAAPDFNKKDKIQYTSDSEGNMIAMTVGADGTPTRVKNKDNTEIEKKHKHELELKERSCNALESIAKSIGAQGKEAVGKAAGKLGKGLFGGLLDSLGNLLNMLFMGLPVGTYIISKLKSLPGKLFNLIKEKIPAALKKIVPDSLKGILGGVTKSMTKFMNKFSLKGILSQIAKHKKGAIGLAAGGLLAALGGDNDEDAEVDNTDNGNNSNNNTDSGNYDEDESDNNQNNKNGNQNTNNNKEQGSSLLDYAKSIGGSMIGSTIGSKFGKKGKIIGGGLGMSVGDGDLSLTNIGTNIAMEYGLDKAGNLMSKLGDKVTGNAGEKAAEAATEKAGEKAAEKGAEKATAKTGESVLSKLVPNIVKKHPLLAAGSALLGYNALSSGNGEEQQVQQNGQPQQQQEQSNGLVDMAKMFAGDMIGTSLGRKIGGYKGAILGSGIGMSAGEGDMSLSNIATNTALNYGFNKVADLAENGLDAIKGKFSTGAESGRDIGNASKSELVNKVRQGMDTAGTTMSTNIQMAIGKIKSGMQTVVRAVGKWLPGKGTASAVQSFCEALMKKIASPAGIKAATRKLAQQATTAAAGAASFGAGALVTEAAFAVTNFIHGMNNAEEMMKLPQGSAPTGVKVAAGLVSAFCGAIPLIGAFIPEDWVLEQCINIVGPSLGFSKSDLEKLRKAGNKEEQQAVRDAAAPTTEGNSVADQIKSAAKGAVGAVIQGAESFASTVADNARAMASSVSTAAGKALSWASDTASKVGSWISNKASNGYKWLSNTASTAYNGIKEVGSKVANTVSSGIDWVKDTGKSAINKGKELVGTATQKVSDFFHGKGKHSTTGRGKSTDNLLSPQYGMGFGRGQFYSQLDPAYAMDMNVAGDDIKQTMADSGCGPMSAANAISALGKDVDPKEAAKYALDNGFKEKDGGIRPGFFKSYMAGKGINAKNLHGSEDILDNLKQGHPVVLMGQDEQGESDKNPYAENPHYVTATSVDSDGNIEVQDPESYEPNKTYKAEDVLSKTSIAIGASNEYNYGDDNSMVSAMGKHKSYGRGKTNTKISRFGLGKVVNKIKNKFGKGPDDDLSPEHMWALANWCGEKTNVDPKLIFGQWYLESTHFTSKLARENYNFGGMTQSGPTGDPSDKQPDGNGYYMHFDNPEQWAEYFAWYLNQEDNPPVGGISDPDEYGHALKSNGYFGADVNEYIKGIKYGISQIPGKPNMSLIDQSKFGKRNVGNPKGRKPNNSNNNKGNTKADYFKAAANSATLVKNTITSAAKTIFGRGKHAVSKFGRGLAKKASASPSRKSTAINKIAPSHQSKNYNAVHRYGKGTLIVNKPSHYGKGYGKRKSTYGRGTDVPEAIWNFLTNKGLGSVATAAIMGNIKVESAGYDPGAVEGGSGAGHGLCQWTAERWNGPNGLEQFAKSKNKDWKDLDLQLEFLWKEIGPGGYFYDALQRLNGMKDINQATKQWLMDFEMGGAGENEITWSLVHLDWRQEAAKEAFEKQGKGIATTGNLSGGNQNNSNNQSNGRQGIFGALDELSSKLHSITSLFGSSNSTNNNSSNNTTSTQNPNGGKDNKVGKTDKLDMDVIESNHPGDNHLTDLENLKPEVKAALNIFGKDYKQRHNKKLMITGGAETWIHADGKWSHHTGWKTDIDTDLTEEDKAELHNMGASVNLEGNHYDIDWSGHDSRDKNTGVNGIGAQGKHRRSRFGMGKHPHSVKSRFGMGKHPHSVKSIFGMRKNTHKSLFGKGDMSITWDSIKNADNPNYFDINSQSSSDDTSMGAFKASTDTSAQQQDTSMGAFKTVDNSKTEEAKKTQQQNSNNQQQSSSPSLMDQFFGSTKSMLDKAGAITRAGFSAFLSKTGSIAEAMLPDWAKKIIGSASSFLFGNNGNDNSNNNNNDNSNGKNFNGGSVSVPASGSAAAAMKQALSCEITSGYGPRNSGFHHGVDFGVSDGTQLPTLVDGVVDDVGNEPTGYGNFIVVKDSKGSYHIFGHLTRAIASKGDTVKAGQIIAQSGHSGHCIPDGPDGAHLHYGIYTDPSCAGGTGALNPEEYDISGLSQSGKGKHSKFGMGKQGWTGGTRKIRAKKTNGSDEGMPVKRRSYREVSNSKVELNKTARGKKSLFGKGFYSHKSTLQEDLANTRNMSTVRFPEDLNNKGTTFGITDEEIKESQFGKGKHKYGTGWGGLINKFKKYYKVGKKIYDGYNKVKDNNIFKKIFHIKDKKEEEQKQQEQQNAIKQEQQDEQQVQQQQQTVDQENGPKDTNKLIAPNGRVYTQNDIKYILDNPDQFNGAKTIDDAINILSNDPKYTKKENSPSAIDKAVEDGKFVSPNGLKYSSNDIQYILDHPDYFGGAKTVEDAIKILEQDPKYTKAVNTTQQSQTAVQQAQTQSSNTTASTAVQTTAATQTQQAQTAVQTTTNQPAQQTQTAVQQAQTQQTSTNNIPIQSNTQQQNTNNTQTSVQEAQSKEIDRTAPNGSKYSENDVKYILDHPDQFNGAKTVEDAIKILEKDPKYAKPSEEQIKQENYNKSLQDISIGPNGEIIFGARKYNNAQATQQAQTSIQQAQAQAEQKKYTAPNGTRYSDNDIKYILDHPDYFNGASTIDDAIAILSKDPKYTKPVNQQQAQNAVQTTTNTPAQQTQTAIQNIDNKPAQQAPTAVQQAQEQAANNTANTKPEDNKTETNSDKTSVQQAQDQNKTSNNPEVAKKAEEDKKLKEEIADFEGRFKKVSNVKTIDDANNLLKGISDDEIKDYNKPSEEDDMSVLKAKVKKNIELHIQNLKTGKVKPAGLDSTDTDNTKDNSVSKAQLEQKFNIGKEGTNGKGPNGKPYTNNDILYILKNPDKFGGAKTVEDAIKILEQDPKYTKKDKEDKSNSTTTEQNKTEENKNEQKPKTNNGTSTGNDNKPAENTNNTNNQQNTDNNNPNDQTKTDGSKPVSNENNNQPDKVDQLIAAHMKTNELLAALVSIATTIANNGQTQAVSNNGNESNNNNYASKQDLAKVALATRLNSFFSNSNGIDKDFINPDLGHGVDVIKHMQTIASM